jgi:hypothetical protein
LTYWPRSSSISRQIVSSLAAFVPLRPARPGAKRLKRFGCTIPGLAVLATQPPVFKFSNYKD